MTARIRRQRSGILTAAQVAEQLHGRSASWFHEHWEDLKAAGHPLRDDLLGGWHAAAVREWIDKRKALTAGSVQSKSVSPYQARL